MLWLLSLWRETCSPRRESSTDSPYVRMSMRSEWSCWRQRAIGEENPAERAVEIYLIGMKKDTEEFSILSGAKPKRTGAPSGFTWSANRGNGDLSSFDGIKKEDPPPPPTPPPPPHTPPPPPPPPLVPSPLAPPPLPPSPLSLSY